MNAQWQAHLEAHGARIDAERVTNFKLGTATGPVALDTDILSDLSHDALIRVSGPDAHTFLQGQLSTDVHALNAHTSQISAYHSPQGRVLAVLRLFVYADSIYILLPRALRETVQKRLAMFVLRAKVEVEDVSSSLARFGVAGPRAPELLADAGWPRPAAANAVDARENASIIRLTGKLPRFQMHGSARALQALWCVLAEKARSVGEPEWSLRKILAGVPTIYSATQDHFLPQMLNLGALNAIDFKKGCYTGQEVIARLQYRGTLKRRLILAHASTETAVEPGDMLHVAGEEQPAGEVVDARGHPDKSQALLAVVRARVLDEVLARRAALKVGVYGAEVARVSEAPIA